MHGTESLRDNQPKRQTTSNRRPRKPTRDRQKTRQQKETKARKGKDHQTTTRKQRRKTKSAKQTIPYGGTQQLPSSLTIVSAKVLYPVRLEPPTRQQATSTSVRVTPWFPSCPWCFGFTLRPGVTLTKNATRLLTGPWPGVTRNTTYAHE